MFRFCFLYSMIHNLRAFCLLLETIVDILVSVKYFLDNFLNASLLVSQRIKCLSPGVKSVVEKYTDIFLPITYPQCLGVYYNTESG